MQSKYSVPSPFTYSSTTPPQNKRALSSGKNLWPLPENEASEIMKDVNRWLPIIEVNGVSFFELRMQELELKGNELAIAKLTENQILEMDLAEMNRLLGKDLTDPTEARRSLFTKYTDIANKIKFKKGTEDNLDDEQNLKDFIDFLKRNVLQEVADVEKKDFLAKNIAYNFHQSGFPVAASMYYQTKTGAMAISKMDTPEALDESSVQAIFEPPMKVKISCDPENNDAVSFQSTISYQSLTVGQIGGSTSASKSLVDNLTGKKTSFVEVESKINIEAVPVLTSLSERFKLEVHGDDIHISKKIISVSSHGEVKKASSVNTFLSQLFEDPLSGNNGIYLQKGAPKKNMLEPQKTYLYFDGNTLKYMTKDYNGKILQGKIPKESFIPETFTPLKGAFLDDALSKDAQSRNLPVVITNRENGKDVFRLYARKNDASFQFINLSLSKNEQAAFKQFQSVGIDKLSKQEYNLVMKVIHKYHTPPKIQSPRSMMAQLKKLASSNGTVDVKNRNPSKDHTPEQQAALQALASAATQLEYTTPSKKPSLFSRLFYGRKGSGKSTAAVKEKVVAKAPARGFRHN